MAHITPALILASASPRRRELLERVGVVLEVRPAGLDEAVRPGEEAVAHARRLAGAKARAVVARAPDRWVLAADTVVEIGGDILGKPADAREARAMLERLVGAVHRVTTGFALAGPTRDLTCDHVTTDVVMREVTTGEIEEYLAAGEWRGKAGGYAVQGMAAAMVSEIRGSITNVIGLPLSEVMVALAEAGAARPSYTTGRPA